MIPLTDEQKAQILIGDDAEAFVQSELGRTVIGMAKQDVDEAMLAFEHADTTDQAAMAKIQVDVKVARRFENYLSELITRGREVLHAASQQE